MEVVSVLLGVQKPPTSYIPPIHHEAPAADRHPRPAGAHFQVVEKILFPEQQKWEFEEERVQNQIWPHWVFFPSKN